ncbi:IS5 family transposase [Streptomyces sp. NPDC032161]|uniref:IS5 family transposase n=1 Tax=unclassified Streptomyces TaxID=2593676 RepID=UPI0034080695
MCVCSCKPSYDWSLTDAQWAVSEPLLPRRDPRRGGRPLEFPRRLVVDTVLYVLVSGCAWRLVPHDLAPWDVAYRWFRAWTADDTWNRVHDALRERVRVADGRDPQPSAAVPDSQSARGHQGGQAIGYDAGKRVRGRKRHLLVDTCGLVPRAVVHSASVQDRAGAKLVLTGIRELFPQVGLVRVDGGYVKVVDAGLVGRAAGQENLEIVAVPRNADVKGFQVLPRRCVVERTFSWLGRCRRLARDYERKTAHAEAMIEVAMIRLMAARLAGEEIAPHGPIETEAARRLTDDLNNE